jgi:ubiquinone/menaquinone biosynthesis C-methylase UbiE
MSSSNAQREEQAWETYAQSYDLILPILPYYQKVVRYHVDALSIPDVRTVIDVGAGTGNVAVELIARGVRVTAVDVSPQMLSVLRKKTWASSSGGIEIVEQDAQSLSAWPDESFDGANVLLSLFAMHEPRQAFLEIMRVVRRGGKVAITETKRNFQLRPLLDFVEEFLALHPSREELREHWDRVKSANLVLDPGFRINRLTVEEIQHELSASGFTIMSVMDSHLGQCATICATKNLGS